MRGFLIPLALVLAGAGIGSPARAAVDAAGEYEIKAAMYLNVLRLVDWPGAKAEESAAPLVLGVIDSDEMAHALDELARSKAAAGRRIIVRRLSGLAGVEDCKSVFVGGADRKRIEGALRALGKSAVLTVGESEDFIALGGMIDLQVQDDRVQILVDLDMAQGSGLAISSRLLKIAVLKKAAAQ